MNEKEAREWSLEVCEDGSFPVRDEYLELFGAGEIAKRFWHDPMFTLGIEYGILIAVAKIFGDLEE